MVKNDKKQLTREKLLDAAFDEVYANGYHGASTSVILKKSKTPKGSMYHFFPSKKDLVLAVIIERIFPKMDYFFDFTYLKNISIITILENMFIKISKNKLLIINSCPMHKLMLEMAPLDSDFNSILNKHFEEFLNNLSSLLQIGIRENEFTNFNTRDMARFIITSTWGALSISPSLSNSKEFKTNYTFILDILKNKTN